MENFRINITSEPTRAKVYIDDIYTHHLTPSDENELSDVMELLQPGPHVIKVEKTGAIADRLVELVDGDNGLISFELETPGISGEDPDEEDPASVQFSITSNPSGGKVWIDETYTHHLTPSDEKEQRDVLE